MESNWLFFNDLKNTNVSGVSRDRSETGSDREKFGKIDDVVLDLQTGRVALYQLGSGGFLGMGEAKVALPANSVAFRDSGATLQVEEERMQKAPGNNKDEVNHLDSQFIDKVYRHYGYKPFSEI